MDTEGTDSNQRDDDNYETFERVVTWFTLSMSDVLLINIKWGEVERRDGSSINLIKIIITAYQNLFSKYMIKQKKKLIFLIRDSQENKIRKNKIKSSLLNKLNKSWITISNDKNSKFKDFFITDFIFLSSHKSGNFNYEIEGIKRDFKEKSSIFPKDKNKRLNFSDLYEYFNNCFTKILDK